MGECIRCGVALSGDNTTWYRQKNYIHKCNACTRLEKAEWARKARERSPGLAAERSRRHQEKLKANNPVLYTSRQMCQSAKKRARSLGVPFDIDADFIASIAPTHCPVLGVEIKYGGGEKSKASASLDRIIPKDGYTKKNVMVMSLLANTMKNEATPDELIKFARWVLHTHEGGTRKSA